MIEFAKPPEDAAAAKAAWLREGLHKTDPLGRRIQAAVDRYPGALVSFLSPTRPFETTSGDMLAGAARVAAALQALGLAAGDPLAVQLPSWRECVLCYLACLQAGFVIVPIVNIYGPQEVSFILRDSGARTLVLPGVYRTTDYGPLARGYLRNGDVDRIIMVGGDAMQDGVLHWDAVMTAAPPYGEPAVIDPDSIAAIIYTSGTTANPKGARHTHNTLGTQLDGDSFFSRQQRDCCTLNMSPAGHLASLLDILRPFFSGEAAFIMDEWDAAVAVDTIARHRVSRSKGTPFHLNSVVDIAERDGRDLSSLRTWVIGGTSVPPATIKRALGCGIVACRTYGSTEHPTISRNTPDDPEEKRIYTDGRPQPGVRIRFLDEDGRDAPPGEEGEILTLGPQLFVGYTDDSLNKDAFTPEGWFRTGDIGRLDVDGYLRITDRKKDIIIRGGENISAKEVEDALASHPAIADVAVVPAPDPKMGERVCAFVILREGRQFTQADALAHIVGLGMAKQKSPEKIIVLLEFPRTAVGKTRKQDLKAMLSEPSPAA
jgi:cyclohexanecarboxylate-CoA ligase